jgi:hypothetical protein
MTPVIPNYSSEPKRRFWRPSRKWVIRVTLTVACLGVLYIGAFLLLSFLSWHRFAADVAARRARGEGVLKEDFVQSPIPDSSNSAYYLNKAGSALHFSDDDAGLNDAGFLDQLPTERPLPPADLDRLRHILQQNKAVLDNAHRARLCPRTDWKLDYSGSPISATMGLGYLSPSREIAQILGRDVQAKHLDGDDAGAIESIEDLLALSRSLDAQCVLVSRLTSVGIFMLMTNDCQWMTSGLRISKNGGADHAATPQQVEDLIGRLLDDGAQQTAIHQVWRGERMEAIDDALFVAHSLNTFGRYTFYNEADWSFRETDLMLAACNAPHWNACATLLDNSPLLTGSAHPLFAMYAPTWRREARVEFQFRAERRATAILLAIRLYSAEHDGRRPPSLEALVPTYLRSLPEDPYATHGGTFPYRLNSPAAVYSVGEDGLDDGGNISATNEYRWNNPDAVFLIEPLNDPTKHQH